MTNIVPPRRDHELVDDNGLGTVRFRDYLEKVAQSLNNQGSDAEIDAASINLSHMSQSSNNHNFNNINVEMVYNVQYISLLLKKIHDLEVLQ